MRPVDKGAAPTVYAHYRCAGSDLKSRIGEYCSYCERKLETHLAVEHIQPKVSYPALQNSWENFLLACVNCNSSKGDKHVILGDYYWPDRDNTLRALEYVEGGLVRPHPCLKGADRVRAEKTISLTGLDKTPGEPGRKPTLPDKRWLKRQQTWQLAKKARARLTTQDTSTSMRQQIVDTAVNCGMFSIWWTVFAGDVDMRRRLRKAFTGTHGASFDANENPVPRAGGLL